MARALFRFYAELNDFLPPARRGISFTHAFDGRPSLKDVVESLGVPHTEVDLLLVDGVSVEFSCPLFDGARVSVYPVFESFDIAPLTRVRPEPLRELRFVLDGHLARLARYLRMAGFDASWRREAQDDELARASVDEGRVLLTRDRGLLKRRLVSRGYWVREVRADRQLTEVVARFDLARSLRPFTRCLACNERLAGAESLEVAERVPPRVRERETAFRRCPSCRRLYWAGSHHRRMEQILAEALARAARPSA